MAVVRTQSRIQENGAAFSPGPLDQTATFSSIYVQEETENIVNRKGGVNSSLYQSCLALRRRLIDVPDFDPFLQEMIQEEQESGDGTDPVTSMWNMLRQGFPLMAIYNALRPVVMLEVDQSKLSERQLGKAATFKFLEACLHELKFPANECFLITDLYGHDTTGFVKVLKVINGVLDILQQRGLLIPREVELENNGDASSKPRSHQENVIQELVITERDYVQHLETLQQFKNQLEQANVVPGDVIHSIFMNLNTLLDFQRRFLIRIEQQNFLDPSSQNWGQLFSQYQEGFRVYEPFIANQTRCNDTVTKEWAAIRSAPLAPSFQGMVETQSVLSGFLLKPFQRLIKYPMLLEQLVKKGDYDEEKIEALKEGIAAMEAILGNANEAIAKEARLAAVDDLVGTVDDWKGHKIEHFGELVIFGNQTVLKGEGQKEVEREYKIYLFERILLCCKEININKSKNRLGNRVVEKKGKPRLQLKGRIFMQNVTDVLTFMKSGTYHLHIFWKGDPGIEHFIIRYLNAETRDKWFELVQLQRRACTSSSRSSGQTSTSQIEFMSMSGANLQNPYEQDGDEDDEEVRFTPGSTPATNHSEISSSRNASNTSLRSRSATSGSGPTPPSLTGRMPPPRFPLPEPLYGPTVSQLRVATMFNSSLSTPEERGGNSYFSPAGESPSSMRSSTQVSTYPFPRQSTSSTSSWTPVDNNNKHNTAPPIGRGPMREDDMNSYTANGRNAQRPSLPAMQTAQQLALAQQRLRSISSPDVQNAPGERKRPLNGHMQSPSEDIPVPPLPPHVVAMRVPVNRSQTNSPTDGQRSARLQPPPLSRAPQSFPNMAHENSYPNVRSDPRYHSATGLGPTSSLETAGQRVVSPVPPSAASQGEIPTPSQLKVKVFFEPQPSHVTIVVPVIISHRSLVDRIDSKMERVTTSSIARGSARLKYCDSEDEMITIDNDDDIAMAIEEWTEANENSLRGGTIPDFELYWFETKKDLPQ